jgi:hypothetical protein
MARTGSRCATKTGRGGDFKGQTPCPQTGAQGLLRQQQQQHEAESGDHGAGRKRGSDGLAIGRGDEVVEFGWQRRIGNMIVSAEQRFPVRIRVGVPPGGFGQRHFQITAWTCHAAQTPSAPFLETA